MKENVVLSGRHVYSQVRLIDNSDTGAPEPDKNGDPYWRMSYGGKAFIVREDIYQAYKKGEISQLTLTPTQFERPAIDENGVEIEGETQTVEGFQYSGHITFEQDINITKNLGMLKAVELKAAKELGLTAEELAGAL